MALAQETVNDEPAPTQIKNAMRERHRKSELDQEAHEEWTEGIKPQGLLC